jgi:hypothetical protein
MSPLFETHDLNESGIVKVKLIRDDFNTLLEALLAYGPVGTREFSIVKTKLEEACFYAVKNVASDPQNQL